MAEAKGGQMNQACLTIAALALLPVAAIGATIVEDFASDPSTRGWRTFGQGQLFRWDSKAENLQVTWDSSKPNSYYYLPLGTVLGKSDDVQLGFDLRIEEIAVGVSPDKPFTFEVAVGLMRLADATSPIFLRGTGSQSPNLLEFDYFPDTGFGATVSPVIVSSNNQIIPSFTAPLELAGGAVYSIQLRYTAADQTLATIIHRDGEIIGPIKEVNLGPTFTDYRLDAVSISSYSDEGAGGSLLAQGTIDNVTVAFPDPPTIELSGAVVEGIMQVTFIGRTNWIFTLERSDDWKGWRATSTGVARTEGQLVLRDESSPAPGGAAFYRVRSERAE